MNEKKPAQGRRDLRQDPMVTAALEVSAAQP